MPEVLPLEQESEVNIQECIPELPCPRMMVTPSAQEDVDPLKRMAFLSALSSVLQQPITAAMKAMADDFADITEISIAHWRAYLREQGIPADPGQVLAFCERPSPGLAVAAAD